LSKNHPESWLSFLGTPIFPPIYASCQQNRMHHSGFPIGNDAFLKFIYIFLNFIRIYSLYRREFIVTFPIRLILYISYIVPIISPLNSLPASVKEIERGFFVQLHISI
jgi:hypothetical protein